MEAIFVRSSNYFMQLFDYGDVNFRMCKIREFLFRFVCFFSRVLVLEILRLIFIDLWKMRKFRWAKIRMTSVLKSLLGINLSCIFYLVQFANFPRVKCYNAIKKMIQLPGSLNRNILSRKSSHNYGYSENLRREQK